MQKQVHIHVHLNQYLPQESVYKTDLLPRSKPHQMLVEVVLVVLVLDQEILHQQVQLKDLLAAVELMLQLMAVEEAEVLLKLVKLVLLLKVAMVEMELHLLYLVLQ